MQLLRINGGFFFVFVFFFCNEYAVCILVHPMGGAIPVHSCVQHSDHTEAVHAHEVKREKKVFSGKTECKTILILLYLASLFISTLSSYASGEAGPWRQRRSFPLCLWAAREKSKKLCRHFNPNQSVFLNLTNLMHYGYW